jgi:arabinan endo-1,5-alpha-L-arabinosidase
VTAIAALGALALLFPLIMTTHSPAGFLASARRVDIPAPLLYSRSFPDPTVVESRVGLVGAATAPSLNIGRASSDSGPWNVIASPALTRRPDWTTSEAIWAPDIQRAPGGWLMYYAAEIAAAGDGSRCIGVAYSKKSYGPYTPIGNAPLVCPLGPGVPRAADTPPAKVLGKHVGPRGVIDPSSFIGNKGQRYLVYRTQGTPSSIRLVKLSQRGRRILEGHTSMLLTTHPGIEENPVITRHDDKWVMLTSVGWFGHCGYRTYWRRSPDVRDWSRATPKLLLSTADGLCGPGGADAVQRRDGRSQLYFHAWTCYLGAYPCPDDWNMNTPKKRHGVRALYGANLRWTAAGRPVVESWIASVLPPPPPPTPTVTPTPTPTPTDTVSPTVSPSTPTDSPTVTDTVTETTTGTGSPTVTP